MGKQIQDELDRTEEALSLDTTVDKTGRVMVLGAILSFLIPLITGIFLITSYQAKADDATDLSLYNITSQIVTRFNSDIAPKSGDSDTGGTSDYYAKAPNKNNIGAGKAGSLLGFSENIDEDSGGVTGWLTSQLSSSSVTFSHDQLKQLQVDGSGGLYDYALYGSVLQNDYGLIETRSSGQTLSRNFMGMLFIVAYWCASIATSIFGMVLSLLSYFNPFRFFATLVGGVGALEIPLLSGVADTMGELYEVIQNLAMVFLIPLMLMFTLASIFMFRAPAGKKILRLYVRFFFMFAGLPIIGATYTGIIDSLADQISGSSQFADYIVVTTFVDVENWATYSRLAPPQNNKIDIASFDSSVASVSRSMAFEINTEYTGRYKQAKKGLTASDAFGDLVDTTNPNDDGKNSNGIFDGDVFSLLTRYMVGSAFTSSDYEGYVTSRIVNDSGGDRDQVYKMFTSYEQDPKNNEDDKHLFDMSLADGGSLVLKDIGGDILAESGGVDLDSYRKGATFESKYKKGKQAPLAGKDSVNAGLSPLAMYNFLNTSFSPTSLTVYSPTRASSGFVRESHASVTLANTGWFGFLHPMESIIVMFAFSALSFVYAWSMVKVAYGSIPRITTSIFGTALGSIAFTTKLLVSVVVLIIEVIGSVLLYLISEEIMRGIMSNADKLVASMGTNIAGFAAESLTRIAIIFLSLVLVVVSIKNRKIFVQLMEDTVEGIIEKLMGVLDENVNQGNPFGSSTGMENARQGKIANHAQNGGGISNGLDGLEQGIKGAAIGAIAATNNEEQYNKNLAGVNASEIASNEAYKGAYDPAYAEGMDLAEKQGLEGEDADDFAHNYADEKALGIADAAGDAAYQEAFEKTNLNPRQKLAKVSQRMGEGLAAQGQTRLDKQVGPVGQLAAIALGYDIGDGQSEERLQNKYSMQNKRKEEMANFGDLARGGANNSLRDKLRDEKSGTSEADVSDEINPTTAQDTESFEDDMTVAHLGPNLSETDEAILNDEGIEPDQEAFGPVEDLKHGEEIESLRADAFNEEAAEIGQKKEAKINESQDALNQSIALRQQADQAEANGNPKEAKDLRDKSKKMMDKSESLMNEAQSLGHQQKGKTLEAERAKEKSKAVNSFDTLGDKTVSDAMINAGGTGEESFTDPDAHPEGLDFASDDANQYSESLHDASASYTKAAEKHASRAVALDKNAKNLEDQVTAGYDTLDKSDPDYADKKSLLDEKMNTANLNRKQAQAERDQGQSAIRKAKVVDAKAKSADMKRSEAIVQAGSEDIKASVGKAEKASAQYNDAKESNQIAQQTVSKEVDKLDAMRKAGASDSEINQQVQKVSEAQESVDTAQKAVKEESKALQSLRNTGAPASKVKAQAQKVSQAQSAVKQAEQSVGKEVSDLETMRKPAVSDSQMKNQVQKVTQAQEKASQTETQLKRASSNVAKSGGSKAVNEVIKQSGATGEEVASATVASAKALDAVQSKVVKKNGAVDFKETNKVRSQEVAKQSASYDNRLQALDEKAENATSPKERMAINKERASVSREKQVFQSKLKAGSAKQQQAQREVGERASDTNKRNAQKTSWSKQASNKSNAVEKALTPKFTGSVSDRYAKNLKEMNNTVLPVKRAKLKELKIDSPAKYKSTMAEYDQNIDTANKDLKRSQGRLRQAVENNETGRIDGLKREVATKQSIFKDVEAKMNNKKEVLRHNASGVFSGGFGKGNPKLKEFTGGNAITGDMSGIHNNLQVYTKQKKRLDLLSSKQKRGLISKSEQTEMSTVQGHNQKIYDDLVSSGFSKNALSTHEKAKDATDVFQNEWVKVRDGIETDVPPTE